MAPCLKSLSNPLGEKKRMPSSSHTGGRTAPSHEAISRASLSTDSPALATCSSDDSGRLVAQGASSRAALKRTTVAE